MAVTWQFVDSIASSPTTLLDLNNQSPFKVATWNAPPPPKNRSVSSSSAYDGANVAQESFSDREITLTVNIMSTSQDTSATAIQALGRLLTQGQWLKFNPGTTNPVFFRTKPAEIDQLNDFNFASDGFRTATLTIPAEPFAYGLPESGSATIANDPTAGTNPMSYVFPTVKGDVATPLVLNVPLVAGDGPLSVFSSLAASSVPAAPYWLNVSSTTLPTGGGGTTISNHTDTTAIGGTARRVVTTGVAGAFPFLTAAVTVPSGDYRVFARATSSVNATLTLTLAGGGSVFGASPVSATASSWAWYDMGVARMPAGAPQGGDPFGLSLATTRDIAASLLTTAAATFDMDAVLFLPVDPDGPTSATFLRADITGSATAGKVYVDGANEAVTQYIGASAPYIATQVLVDGAGMPRVVPGQANLLTYMRRTGDPTAHTADNKTLTTAIAWSYYPRYLYVRPATT